MAHGNDPTTNMGNETTNMAYNNDAPRRIRKRDNPHTGNHTTPKVETRRKQEEQGARKERIHGPTNTMGMGK